MYALWTHPSSPSPAEATQVLPVPGPALIFWLFLKLFLVAPKGPDTTALKELREKTFNLLFVLLYTSLHNKVELFYKKKKRKIFF